MRQSLDHKISIEFLSTKMSIKSVLICLCFLGFTTGLTNAWAPYPLFENTIYDYRKPELSTKRRSLNEGNPEDFRNAVFEVCRYTFAGAWNMITAQQMRFYELNRSLEDRWYYCGLPFDLKPFYREYGEATVVFYGPGRRNPEDTNTVSRVHAYFSQKQAQTYSTLITPRILGSFPGGRVEEYWSVICPIDEMAHNLRCSHFQAEHSSGSKIGYPSYSQ